MAAVEEIPVSMVQAVLQDHLVDETATVTDLAAEPILCDGFSGNTLYRARVAWTAAGRNGSSGSADWVIKRWLPGGHS